MIAGITLIMAGLLLVLYPPLLSIIVALLLIIAGSMVLAMTHYERKLQRHHRNPTVEFFFWH
jgi:drug/metabolite transporter (DMT)-like permease